MPDRAMPLVGGADEVRRLLAGDTVEIRRAVTAATSLVDGRKSAKLFASLDLYAWAWADPGPSPAGNPGPYIHAPRSDDITHRHDTSHRVYSRAQVGDTLRVREAWKAWSETCNERDVDDYHVCAPHCRQVYVAYEATPRVGYRPVPDKARITYLLESTPLDRNRKLFGPWLPAELMPRWASRLSVEVAALRCERSTAGAWEWVLTCKPAEVRHG